MLLFVALDSADLHILRVAQRVTGDGHDIPAATIRRRYEICFEKLAKALPLCDIGVLFDNSGQQPVKKLELQGSMLQHAVLDETRMLDRRFASAVEMAHPDLRESLFAGHGQ
ncbi:hypothetical protein BJF92_11540 [Rhizobium rhizosphaerae]|uniref:Uncharacterized protein n=2 Tax=Xaviernesmea rhizosphaerae TaxID=1672749 RepID=A0A1Q9AN09_9HYPH|nr:hypothetical protein BJF92_11540 [Xaviernesmea rhizosphaerae]